MARVAIHDDLTILGDLFEPTGDLVHRNEQGRVDPGELPLFGFADIQKEHSVGLVAQAMGHLGRGDQ